MGKERQILVEPGLESPLDAAVAHRDRGTLSMVRHALSNGNAVLAFQPVMRADGAGIAYYEGLIRILDDTGRIIPAKDFIHVVEDRDLGRQIDCAALKMGLNALRMYPSLRLAVNASARSVGYPGWLQILRKSIRMQPAILRRLILEISEPSAMQMPEILTAFMSEMQDKGVTFALDDFGAGYTAFRHLKTFCFDILKIDGQFTHDVDSDPDNQVLCEALIALARHLDLTVVSESVETEREARWLTKAGVDCLQGYYFGAPSMTPPWTK